MHKAILNFISKVSGQSDMCHCMSDGAEEIEQ